MVRQAKYTNNYLIPQNNIFGGSFYLQNINTEYTLTNTYTLKYPIHSIYLDEGIYNNVENVLKNMNQQFNKDNLLLYDWKLRDWVERNKSNILTNYKLRYN